MTPITTRAGTRARAHGYHGCVSDQSLRLSEARADAALRRAAQLQAEAAERIERQTLARASEPADARELEREELLGIAREAGIAEEFVTLALAESEPSGAATSLVPLAPEDERAATRWLGSKRRSISISRRYDMPAAELLALVPEVFESDEFRLRFDGQSGGHPLQGGVMTFQMPRLGELVTQRGVYTPLCYRLEQLEMWRLQVALHDHGPQSELVIYGDLRRGAKANVKAAKWFTGSAGLVGLVGVGLLAGSLGPLALLPALAAAAAAGGATQAAYRGSYRAALERGIEELERLLAAVARRGDRKALLRGPE